QPRSLSLHDALPIFKSGGKISSTSTGKSTFEGTQIEGGTGVELEAKEIDFKAARNTETSSESSTNVNASANMGANMGSDGAVERSEEHTSELQSREK